MKQLLIILIVILSTEPFVLARPSQKVGLAGKPIAKKMKKYLLVGPVSLLKRRLLSIYDGHHNKDEVVDEKINELHNKVADLFNKSSNEYYDEAWQWFDDKCKNLTKGGDDCGTNLAKRFANRKINKDGTLRKPRHNGISYDYFPTITMGLKKKRLPKDGEWLPEYAYSLTGEFPILPADHVTAHFFLDQMELKAMKDDKADSRKMLHKYFYKKTQNQTVIDMIYQAAEDRAIWYREMMEHLINNRY